MAWNAFISLKQSLPNVKPVGFSQKVAIFIKIITAFEIFVNHEVLKVTTGHAPSSQDTDSSIDLDFFGSVSGNSSSNSIDDDNWVKLVLFVFLSFHFIISSFALMIRTRKEKSSLL